MEEYTHVCVKACTKHDKYMRPGDKITLADGESALWFAPINKEPGKEEREESEEEREEGKEDLDDIDARYAIADPDPLIELADKLNDMTKDELEVFAKENYAKEVDKRNNNKHIVKQVLKWAEEAGA